jgi:hypothetical protein
MGKAGEGWQEQADELKTRQFKNNERKVHLFTARREKAGLSGSFRHVRCNKVGAVF